MAVQTRVGSPQVRPFTSSLRSPESSSARGIDFECKVSGGALAKQHREDDRAAQLGIFSPVEEASKQSRKRFVFSARKIA